MKILKCERCGYEWASRKENRPSGCAKCKNKNWDKKIIFSKLSRIRSDYWKNKKGKVKI